jgi:hypothetical protein
MKTENTPVSHGWAPSFGEKVMNPHASEENPRKYSFFVGEIHRTGRTNKGKWFRCTDGAGRFWDSKEIAPMPNIQG